MPGSIEHRGKNRWRIRIPGGYDDNGAKVWLASENIKFDDDTTEHAQCKECERRLALLYSKVVTGEVINAKEITVREFSKRWMNDYVKPNLTPMSAESYQGFLDRQILPKLGKVKMQDMKPYVITKFINGLSADGLHKNGGKLSGTTIAHYYNTLSAMLTKAVEWQVIAVSPMKHVAKPKKTTKPAKFYDDKQALDLLWALENAPLKYKAAAYIAIFGGMRIGEVVGLEWRDINFETRHVLVERASLYLPDKGIYTAPTKTDKPRDFMLPRLALITLVKYKQWQDEEAAKMGDTWEGTGRLFTTWNGLPMHPDTPSKWHKKFLKKNGLPHLPFHSLRHTNATLLLAKGMALHVVSERLGHTRPSMTTDTYGHAIPNMDEVAADIFDDMYLDILVPNHVLEH